MSKLPKSDPALRNRYTAAVCAVIAVSMVGMAYAAVPLYRLFCQVTGFAGTTQRAESAPGPVLDRTMAVRFDSNVGPGLNWDFRPAQREVRVRIGEPTLAFYRAVNRGRAAVTGSAVFNVTPPQAGAYFTKIECFCFTEQTLKAGETAELPVQFFIDPEIVKDPDLAQLDAITLSYTFYPSKPVDRTATVN